jgi:hypothetical protein
MRSGQRKKLTMKEEDSEDCNFEFSEFELKAISREQLITIKNTSKKY